MISFAGQNWFCPWNWLYDMRNNKHQKPSADWNAIWLAEFQESLVRKILPFLVQQQPLLAVMPCSCKAAVDRSVLDHLSSRGSVKLLATFSRAFQHLTQQSIVHPIIINTVRSLQLRPFYLLTLEEKLVLKRVGRDRPKLSTKSCSSSSRFTKT